MNDRPTSSRAYALACVCALGLLTASYANHFHNAFHFDDGHTVENNAFIRDLHNIPSFFSDPKTFSSLPANQSYRPLVTTSLAIDYWLGGGLDPFAFQVTNFLLFAIQCVAMLFLFRRLMDLARPDPSNRWLALLAATWYAVHTANAETVNYVIARSDILSTLGVVLALLLFAQNGVVRRYWLYLVPVAAALFAKEQGAMVAPLLFLYVGLFEQDLSLRELARPRAVLAILRETWPAVVTAVGLLVMGMSLATTFRPGGTSRWLYLLTQPFVMLHYALTFALPVNLSPDTDWELIRNPFDDRVSVGVIFIVCAIGFVAWASRRRETKPIAFGILWFFVALLPTSSLIPLAEVMNDHRMYFPFVGLALAATWGLRELYLRAVAGVDRRPWMCPVAIVAAILMLGALANGTRMRNNIWHTEESLWRDVTIKSPRNGRGLMTYGVIQMGQGHFDVAGQYFDRALQFTPQYAYLHVNIGVLKGAQGDKAEAERHFQLAQQYDPGNPVSYTYYARWLNSVGRSSEAAVFARRAVALSPADLAAQELLRTIESRPLETAENRTPEQWLALSLTQFQAGQFEESIASSQGALRLRPGYAEAYNNICAAHNALGRYAEGAAACETALSLKPDFQLARNNLAFAQSKLRK